MNGYRMKTTEQLIEMYAFEAGRVNQEDKKIAQCHIKTELKRRFDTTLRLLDTDEVMEKPQLAFNYLLGK